MKAYSAARAAANDMVEEMVFERMNQEVSE